MSDFTFACPACGNGMSVNDQYVGQQVSCPTCHAPTVIPANPATAAGPSISTPGAPGQPPPPAVPKNTRLSVSALSQHGHAPAPAAPAAPSEPAAPESPQLVEQGSAGYRAHMARKPKKSYAGVIAGVSAVVVIGVLAYLNRNFIEAKYKSVRGPTAEEIAATNKPPPPPPELTAPEIITQVAALYKTLPNFSSTGKATAVLDESAISPALAAAGPKTFSADLKLKMNRPASYRVDMTIDAGTTNLTALGWSTGNGDMYQSRYSRSKMMSKDQVFNTFAAMSDGVSGDFGDIIRLFMDDNSKGLAKDGIEWKREKDQVIEAEPNYVLSGSVDLHDVKVWVNRRTFLISQTQVVLDGSSGASAMDDNQIKEQLQAENGKPPSLKDIADFKRSLKIKGAVTDTYGNIQTNTAFAATDFQPDPPAARTRGGTQPQNGMQPQPQPGGRATQIANGRRRGG